MDAGRAAQCAGERHLAGGASVACCSLPICGASQRVVEPALATRDASALVTNVGGDRLYKTVIKRGPST